jgi:hypothetical protein
VVLIRIWLCSAFRVRQPNRPVSGIPASPAANRRVLALFRSSGKVASVESGWRLAPSRRIGCRRGSRVPQSHAAPPRQPYPIEIPTLTQRLSNHTVRETHLAKKALQMRLPISSHRRNPLKKRGLKGRE